MIEQGNILYINDFEYADGGTPTNKFLIILCVDNENSIIIKALPTSQDKSVPDKIQNHGCTNNEYFSFFMFEKGRTVGRKPNGRDFSFDLNTFIIFRDNVSILRINSLLYYYPNRMCLVGQLLDIELQRLLKCVKRSLHLKKKIKNELIRILQNNIKET